MISKRYQDSNFTTLTLNISEIFETEKIPKKEANKWGSVKLDDGMKYKSQLSQDSSLQ